MNILKLDFWCLYKDGYRKMYNEAIKRGRTDVANSISKILKKQ